MDALGGASSILALVELSFKLIGACARYAHGIKNAKNDRARLLEEATRLHHTLQHVRELSEKPQNSRLKSHKPLVLALYESQKQLQDLLDLLPTNDGAPIKGMPGLQHLKWPFQRDEAGNIVQNLSRLSQAISLAIQIDQAETLGDMDQNLILNKLPIAAGASFDSHAEEHNPTCLPNTRVGILKTIHEWVYDPDSKAMFWLNGMAGTGKSTISRTLACSFSRERTLAATFFFKRGEADRGNVSKLIPTIASQLMTREPSVGPYLKSTIEAEPSVFDKTIGEQFEKLIMGPLLKIDENAWKATTFVVILDALDECDGDKDTQLVINLFSRTIRLKSTRLKVFVTSRPQLPIRLGFISVGSVYQDLVLHEVESGVIEKDIRILFEHQLGVIKAEYNSSVSGKRRLSSDWPMESDLQSLVAMAVPLFLFAATVCRFVADRKAGNPHHRLRMVLDYAAKSQTSRLDNLYLPILEQQVVDLSSRERAEVVESFRDIVGAIVTLAQPLAVAPLASLIDMTEEDIATRLDFLHSVLSVPTTDDMPVRLLHISFRDFLLDPERHGSEFWVGYEESHKSLAMNCIRIMMRDLHQDMCNLELPGTDRTSLSAKSLASFLSPTTQYACLFWIYHLDQAKVTIDDGGQIYEFLSRHLLHWIEVVCLLGKLGDSIKAIKALQMRQKTTGNSQLYSLLHDANRFLLNITPAISMSPLQIYSSGLLFAPQKSIVRQLYRSEIPRWISLAPASQDHWDKCLQTLESPTKSSGVGDIAFSADSNYIGVALWNSTPIWQVDNGQCVQGVQALGFAPHVSMANAAFSPDLQLVVSSFIEGWSSKVVFTVRRTDTGQIVREYKEEFVSTPRSSSEPPARAAVAFSPDSSMLALAKGSIIQIRQLHGTECVEELPGHDTMAEISILQFSPDSKFLASASAGDSTVRIWAVSKAKRFIQLKSHSDTKCQSLAFSPDSKLIASSGMDTEICLWQVDNGRHLKDFSGHTRFVQAIAFSPVELGLLASCSHEDYAVQIWRIDSGECIQRFRSRGQPVSVAFSSNSALVACVSNAGAVTMWNLDDIDDNKKTPGHADTVKCVAFSPDSSLLASASYDGAIQLWETNTGACIHVFQAHDAAVWSIAFSADSKLLVSGSDDGEVRLWGARDAKCLGHFIGHEGVIRAVEFSPDSKLIASGSSDQSVRIWRADGNGHEQVLQGHQGLVSTVAFSADSRLVASGHSGLFEGRADGSIMGGYVMVWKLESSQCIVKVETFLWPQSVAFVPNPPRVISTEGPGVWGTTMEVWDLDGGARMRRLELGAYSSELKRLRYGPDTGSLETSLGHIRLEEVLAHDGPTISIADHSLGYGMTDDGCWVTWRGIKLLWIPPEFRASCSAISGSRVAIGSGTGRVSVIGFAAEELLDGVVGRE